jgi:uncharacterized protein YdaU (DUF1376 family)
MNPECSEYQKNIARSLLGDLTAKEAQSLQDHLTTCPNCRGEQESYVQTLSLLKSADDEPVPRHFFVHPEERNLNPWALFRLMKPSWQAITVALAGFFVLASVGWVMSLNRNEIDVAALKRDFLKAAEQQNQNALAIWSQEMRTEIARSRAELTQQQKTELTAALNRLDTRIKGRVTSAEERMHNNAQQLAADVYRAVSQDRARDLDFINLRFDNIEATNAIETRQNNAIFGTLLQAAELRLK